jgi:hypothetical protein
VSFRKTPKARPRLWRWFFGPALGIAFACGPSLASVHEGTVRFEHCNRLDLDSRAGKNECHRCWTTWLKDFTYGQPRDRIDYARRRARALSNGNDQRPALKLGERSPEDRQFYLVVPGPTSVHAPPPPIATVWQGDAGTLASKTLSDVPPAESCAEACRTTWQACMGDCGNGRNGSGSAKGGNGARKSPPSASAKNANACGKCGADYSACMKRCFE